MATNDFIGFASAGSANIMSQADYAAAAEQTDGVQPGPASSALANKIWRQGANMAAALGQMIAGQNKNALDDGDIGALQTALEAALATVDVTSATTAYYALKNGLLIQTGSGTSSTSGAVAINFDHAYAEYPKVLLVPYTTNTTAYIPKAQVDYTYFNFVCVSPSNAYVSQNIRWFAFGIGA